MISSPVREDRLWGSPFPSRMSLCRSLSVKYFTAGAGLLLEAAFDWEGGTCPLGDVMVKSKPMRVYGLEGKSGRLREGNVMDIYTLHFDTLLRKVPKLGLVHWSA